MQRSKKLKTVTNENFGTSYRELMPDKLVERDEFCEITKNRINNHQVILHLK